MSPPTTTCARVSDILICILIEVGNILPILRLQATCSVRYLSSHGAIISTLLLLLSGKSSRQMNCTSFPMTFRIINLKCILILLAITFTSSRTAVLSLLGVNHGQWSLPRSLCNGYKMESFPHSVNSASIRR